jgi:hypothetical protein
VEAIALREVVAVAVRVVLRSSQAGSKPGALEGLVPYLVDLAEKDLAGPVGLASGVRYALQLFLRPGLGFDRAGNRMEVVRLVRWWESLPVEGLQVMVEVGLRRNRRSLA